MIRTVVEERSKNIAVLDVFSKLSQNRILYIESVIDDELANGIVAQLLYLDSLSHEEITIIINSPGGFIYQGLAIVDAMNKVKSPIKTVILGKAMSMGALVFICGDKRQMTEKSTIMFHEISNGMYGKISELTINFKETERLSKIVSKIVKSYTNIENIEKAFEKDTYYDPTDALKLNITDEVL